MRVAKQTAGAKIAFFYAKSKIWKRGLSCLGPSLRMIARRMYTSRVEMFFGVPVHFVQSKIDFKIVLSWLEESAALLTPYWTRQIKSVFKTIVIEDSGPMIKYEQMDKCWTINPVKLGKLRGRAHPDTAPEPAGSRLRLALWHRSKPTRHSRCRHKLPNANPLSPRRGEGQGEGCSAFPLSRRHLQSRRKMGAVSGCAPRPEADCHIDDEFDRCLERWNFIRRPVWLFWDKECQIDYVSRCGQSFAQMRFEWRLP